MRKVRASNDSQLLDVLVGSQALLPPILYPDEVPFP